MRIRRELAIPASVGIVSFVVGIGVGYVLGKSKRNNFIEDEKSIIERRDSEFESGDSDSEIGESDTRDVELGFEYEERTRRFDYLIQQATFVIRELKEEGEKFLVRDIPSEEPAPSPDSPPSSYTTDIESRKEEVMPIKHESEESLVNVYRSGRAEDDDWNYDEELAKRTPNRPYVIHRDEFFGEESGFTQSTITYYASDNVLVDEQDVPIYEADKIVGKLEFGRGSQDRNICYVRNEYMQAEWEVLLDPGYFSVEVLGAKTEDVLKKSDIKHSVPKFRRE